MERLRSSQERGKPKLMEGKHGEYSSFNKEQAEREKINKEIAQIQCGIPEDPKTIEEYMEEGGEKEEYYEYLYEYYLVGAAKIESRMKEQKIDNREEAARGLIEELKAQIKFKEEKRRPTNNKIAA